jgi:hypothetical protein
MPAIGHISLTPLNEPIAILLPICFQHFDRIHALLENFLDQPEMLAAEDKL